MQELPDLASIDCTPAALQEFHRRAKLLLMERSPENCRRLGRIAGNTASRETAALFAEYELVLTATLAISRTPGRDANVLQHAAGYLRPNADPTDRERITREIEEYRQGKIHYEVPFRSIKTLVERFAIQYSSIQYLKDQFLFNRRFSE